MNSGKVPLIQTFAIAASQIDGSQNIILYRWPLKHMLSVLFDAEYSKNGYK